MIILFQNIWFIKEFLACNGCFGLFYKIKKRSRINFWSTFSACFFHTNATYLIIYQLTKFQRHIFFAGYQIKCVIKFLIRQLMTSYTLRIIFSHPQRNDRERGAGEGHKGKSEIRKFECLENEKYLLDQVKCIFHNYLSAIICWIKEK